MKLIEGIDYTLDPETGALVFTREFLLKRGFCCHSRCRECPWRADPSAEVVPLQIIGWEPK